MKTVIYKYEKGTTNYKNYKTDDSNEQIKQDLKANGAYLVKILNEKQIKEIKNINYIQKLSSNNEILIQYIQECL